jgi:hypothetical protein
VMLGMAGTALNTAFQAAVDSMDALRSLNAVKKDIRRLQKPGIKSSST